MITLYKDNRDPSLTDTVKVAGVPFDLSASQVRLRMRLETSATLKVDGPAATVSPAAGTVRYDWQAVDVDTVGEYVAWWRVTTAGLVQDTEEFAVVVKDHLEPSGDLCSVADVREQLELSDSERDRDPLIATYIQGASAQIIREYEREFAPATVSLTARNFPWNPASRTLDLCPFDLRSVSLLRLSPEEAGPSTLVEGSDFILSPVNDPDGVYTSLRFSGWLVTFSQRYFRFGFINVEITGAWGFPTVPIPVRDACVLTVGASLRRDVAALAMAAVGGDLTDIQPDMPANFAIPPAARRKLAPFRRNAGIF
jgi:hypothetical protein